MKIRHTFILLACLCVGCSAGAQDLYTHFHHDLEREKAFLPVYYNYVTAIKTQGIAGLKKLAAPDFTLKWDKETRKGEKAFTELKKYLSDPPKTDPDDAFSVTIRRLQFVGNQAIVQTKEMGMFSALSGNGPKNPDSKFTLTWFWKQTWRKTPQGWRLAAWQKGKEKLSDPTPAVTYNVRWTPKKPDVAPATPAAPDKKPN